MSRAAVSAPPSNQPGVPPFPVYQITVPKYHEMIQKGVLTEDDPVELLEGWIVPKMPRSPQHDTVIDMTDAILRPLLPTGWRIRIQSAITTGDSEPEPDLALVEGDLKAFVTRHPGPSDIGLLIEVAESSRHTDRVEKGRIYARANVPIYWVIDLVDRQVEVYSDPDSQGNPPAYRSCQTNGAGQTVPLILRGQDIAQVCVDDLLP